MASYRERGKRTSSTLEVDSQLFGVHGKQLTRTRSQGAQRVVDHRIPPPPAMASEFFGAAGGLGSSQQLNNSNEGHISPSIVELIKMNLEF